MLCSYSMALAHFPKFPTLICSIKPKKPPFSAVVKPRTTIPARDRVIDFGKYKGKMLGALPSTYLKWVTKNLRAGDSEDWAKLADQVLEDPVYKDRLEWEFAHRILDGSNKNDTLSKNESAVSQLLEISERFGWDNEDKVGWSKIDFELLGTSKGGRIPRTASFSDDKVMKASSSSEKMQKDNGSLSEMEGRRKERRERVKVKSRVGTKKDKLGILRNKEDSFVNEGSRRIKKEDLRVEEINNPFPGREALLWKVLDGKPFL